MIDSRIATRVTPGIAVGSPNVSRTSEAAGLCPQGRFSGPQLAESTGRSVSMFTGDAPRGVSLVALSPVHKIADSAGLAAGGNAINLFTNRYETSADRAQSGARAWSPPD